MNILKIFIVVVFCISCGSPQYNNKFIVDSISPSTKSGWCIYKVYRVQSSLRDEGAFSITMKCDQFSVGDTLTLDIIKKK